MKKEKKYKLDRGLVVILVTATLILGCSASNFGGMDNAAASAIESQNLMNAIADDIYAPDRPNGASIEYYLGYDRATLISGVLDMGSIGYATVRENTSVLGVEHLAQWIYNFGSQPVEYVFYYVQDGDSGKITQVRANLYSQAVQQAGNLRTECDWSSICASVHNDDDYANTETWYEKNGADNMVFTKIVCGNASYLGAGNAIGWDSVWFQSSRVDDFYG